MANIKSGVKHLETAVVVSTMVYLSACGSGSGGGDKAAAGLDAAVEAQDTETAAQVATRHVRQGTPVAAPAPAPRPAPAHGEGPFIDVSKIPAPAAGFAADRVMTTGERPTPSDVGAFRTFCEFSHMNFDDPIVYPGQPGKAHLHVYFGNTSINAATTAQSLATSGSSTCRGGTVNRSGYWAPAMIDTRTGTPIKPEGSHFYYKTGYGGIAPQQVRPFPLGLRMIAGNGAATDAASSEAVRFKCIDREGVESMGGPAIPQCAAGTELWAQISFPQCWDGVNLDSADHRSHMAYPSGGRCPTTHPVAGPEVTFNIVYRVTEQGAPRYWRLSSDHYDTSRPGGYSMHGDWFNGWKPEIMNTWIQSCDRASADCHSHLLGDGRAIY